MNNFNMEAYLNGMLINSGAPIKPNNNSKSALYGPYEGFIKGNMFSNLYDPYKDYQPAQLTPTSQFEEDLLNLNQMQFAAHEANLFLDNFPNDNNMIKKFNEFRQNYNTLLSNFESKYGPVVVTSDVLNTTPWAWDNEPWPWEGDAN